MFKDIKLTDTLKFIITLIIYTAYMSWWASSITSNVEIMKQSITQQNARFEKCEEASRNTTLTVARIIFIMDGLSENDKENKELLKLLNSKQVDCGYMHKAIDEKLTVIENRLKEERIK